MQWFQSGFKVVQDLWMGEIHFDLEAMVKPLFVGIYRGNHCLYQSW